jgi:hypothetical protein
VHIDNEAVEYNVDEIVGDTDSVGVDEYRVDDEVLGDANKLTDVWIVDDSLRETVAALVAVIGHVTTAL